jgi:hypothetical protein
MSKKFKKTFFPLTLMANELKDHTWLTRKQTTIKDQKIKYVAKIKVKFHTTVHP